MFPKLVLLLLIANFLQISNGAKILVYIPTPSFSHQITFRPLWQELSKRGHNLTVLTTDLMSYGNITQIDLSHSYKIMENQNLYEVLSSKSENFVTKIIKAREVLNEVIDYQLSHPEVQRIVKSKEKFDLVISEFLFSVGFAFSPLLQAPSIGVVPLDPHYSAHDVFGNPTHPVLYPDVDIGYNSGGLSFSQRFYSVLNAVIHRIIETQILCRDQNVILEKHFGVTNNIWDIRRNVSMLFINANLIFHRVRPLTPSTINIGGGVHITKPKPLPKKLQEFLDEATDGVIYFSLGSIIKSIHLSNNTKQVLLDAFSELPYKVLWKFEDHSLANKSPNNVIFLKWFPQADLLHHPNIKLFITHGGLQSMEEAIYCHVPMLGLPFYGDQYNNVNKMVEKGFGLALDGSKLEKEKFKKVVVELIVNPKYAIKAKELADLSLDQPMSGLEKAVWWTEFVIRHKGVLHHLKPLEIPFYQYYLIDVIIFVLVVICFVIFIMFITIRGIRKVVWYIKSPALEQFLQENGKEMENRKKIKKN